MASLAFVLGVLAMNPATTIAPSIMLVQKPAGSGCMNAFGEENQEMQAEEDAEYKKAQRYR